MIAFTRRSFWRAFAIYLAPMAVVGGVFQSLSYHQQRDIPEVTWLALVELVAISTLGPAVETGILLYPVHIVSQLLSRQWLACALASLPLTLLHISWGWQKCVIVAWPFMWSAHCYLELMKQGVPVKSRFLFVWGMHALTNFLAMSMAILASRNL